MIADCCVDCGDWPEHIPHYSTISPITAASSDRNDNHKCLTVTRLIALQSDGGAMAMPERCGQPDPGVRRQPASFSRAWSPIGGSSTL